MGSGQWKQPISLKIIFYRDRYIDILKLLGDKKKHTSNISINVLKEHFETVLNTSGSSKEYICSDIDVDPNFTEFYDGVITKEEILDATKN